MNELGRTLIVAGAGLIVIGLLLAFGPRIPYLGRLPGDLSFELGRGRVYVPLGTSIILSIVLTIVLNLLLRR